MLIGSYISWYYWAMLGAFYKMTENEHNVITMVLCNKNITIQVTLQEYCYKLQYKRTIEREMT